MEILLSKGSASAEVFKRATALLELHRGKTLQQVAQTLSVNYNTVATRRDKYNRDGLTCLQDAMRSGRPVEEVLAIVKERSNKQIKINWQFSLESARTKFNRHYHQVNNDNARCLKLNLRCT